MELNSTNQQLQASINSLECEVMNLNKDTANQKTQNTALLTRQRELEELGREMNNISIEASRRERDLEVELQAKSRDLQLREEVLEKNKKNAELLEFKIEELRMTTQRGIATRDEIIQQQSDEIQSLNQTIEETKLAYQANLEGHDAEFTRELNSRDQLIQRYVARIKKQAAKIDTITGTCDTLHQKLEESMGREQELDRVLKAESDRQKLMGDAHRAEMEERHRDIERHLEHNRQLKQEVDDNTEQVRNLVMQVARKEQETDSLVGAQDQQIKAHQLDQQEWADKLLRQEIIHEKEKDELALRLQCKECPGLRTIIKRQKAKLKKQAEQIKLFTLAYPKRAEQRPRHHWIPSGNNQSHKQQD